MGRKPRPGHFEAGLYCISKAGSTAGAARVFGGYLSSIQEETTDEVYGSKMDSWIILVLLVAVAVSGSALVHTVLSGETGHRLSIPLLGVGVILPLWVIFSTNYRVDSQTLSIRSGPFRSKTSAAPAVGFPAWHCHWTGCKSAIAAAKSYSFPRTTKRASSGSWTSGVRACVEIGCTEDTLPLSWRMLASELCRSVFRIALMEFDISRRVLGSQGLR